jgi:hypothetical protein
MFPRGHKSNICMKSVLFIIKTVLLSLVHSWAYPPLSLLHQLHFPPPSIYMTYLLPVDLPDRFNLKAMSSALCINTYMNSTGIFLHCRCVFGLRFALIKLCRYGRCCFEPACHFNVYSFSHLVSGYFTDTLYYCRGFSYRGSVE